MTTTGNRSAFSNEYDGNRGIDVLTRGSGQWSANHTLLPTLLVGSCPCASITFNRRQCDCVGTDCIGAVVM